MRDASDTSSLLFSHLCHDLGFSDLSSIDRFNPFSTPGPVESELDSIEFSKRALLSSIFKKTEIESSPDAESQTFADFMLANKQCGTRTKEDFGVWDGSPAIGYSISAARGFLTSWFSQKLNSSDAVITMSDIETAARFGPGSSTGLNGKPSTLYFKCGDAPMTCSSDFIRSWYESSVGVNPLCEAAEFARKARQGPILVQPHGKLTFVPKSYAKKRIVVTEPSLNTYFQLGLGLKMEEVLHRRTGISFSTQPGINSELARQGSINGDYATMDLKQCSDYISLSLVEYMFPPTLVRWFKILRTKVVEHINDGQKMLIHLDMCSTMGNGFTFPMQTLLLAACILGVYDTLGIPDRRNNSRTYGVFGDDIIVVKEAYPLLSQVLLTLGLKVNDEKSFATGNFRESCGTDYYGGINVRGVYFKKYTTNQDLFSCFNRLSLWSAEHEIALPSTLSCILQLVRGPIPLVPPDEEVTAGIVTPTAPSLSGEDGCWVYYPYKPVPSSFSFEPWEAWEALGRPSSNKVVSRRVKQWVSDLKRYCDGSINEPAALKVLLAGGLRRRRIFIRNDNVRYRQVVSITPRWGYSGLETFPVMGSGAFRRLDVIVKQAFHSFLTVELKVG